MPKKPAPTDENKRYERILGNNIRRIYERYTTSMEEFYLQYINPMRGDQKAEKLNEEQREALRQRMVRFIEGKLQMTYEELLELSNIAGVSINELLTEEIDIERSCANTRDVIYTLFNLLDRMYMTAKEVEVDGEKMFAICPDYKDVEMFSWPERSIKEDMKFTMGHFINEFLREYVKRKGQQAQEGERKPTDVDNYRLWRKRVLMGAFAFMVNGQEYEKRTPTDEAKQIADNALEAMKKQRDEAWNKIFNS